LQSNRLQKYNTVPINDINFPGETMKKTAVFTLLMLSMMLSFPHLATASRSVAVTLEGCVIQGVFYAVEKGGLASGATRVNVIEIINRNESDPKMDLSPYEGKKISLQGRLLPGDRLTPDPKSLKVLGPCDRDSQAAIAEERELLK
jgi:hypothetical protein